MEALIDYSLPYMAQWPFEQSPIQISFSGIVDTMSTEIQIAPEMETQNPIEAYNMSAV